MDRLEDDTKSILENVIDPNKDKDALKIDKLREVENKPKSRVPKNHPISNIIGNIDDSMVTRSQSRLNEIDFVCYASQLKPKNVEETLGYESWTTTP